MKSTIQPLVVTPKCYKFESIKGYILRVSEANGYETPTVMLSGAGMTNGEMNSIIPPLDRLSALLNRSISEMQKLGYHKPYGSASAKRIWLHNNEMPTIYLNIKSPKICPECIVESGFTDSFWDLKFAIGCPLHDRYLLKSCPDCKKPLSWFRPGLLKCKCGCDLSKFGGESLNNNAVLGLLTFMRNLLRREPHKQDYLMQKLGFPVDHLMMLTLPELLSIIVRFENKGGHLNKSIGSVITYQEEMTLERVSHALKNWPEGLYSYLDSFNHDRVSMKGFGIRKQFESFYGSLFKSNIPKEKISFIKDAFIKFGLEKWQHAFVTNKLASNVENKHLVGIYGLADNLGVMPSTARRMVNQSLIPSTTVTHNGKSRKLINLEQEFPFKATPGKTFTVRKAAAWLGLPVGVLKKLRSDGDFKVQHIATPFSAYHELDLMIFRDRLFACCKSNTITLPQDYLTLKQVMLMKVGPEIKASFVRAFINGDIDSIGNLDKIVNGIQFSKNDVMQFIKNAKIKLMGTLTIVEAAKMLRCDPKVVKNLQHDGVLKGTKQPSGLFILQDSLNEFAKHFISCAELASLQKLSSAKIVQFCKQKMIKIHYFSRGNGLNPQPFVDRCVVNTVF